MGRSRGGAGAEQLKVIRSALVAPQALQGGVDGFFQAVEEAVEHAFDQRRAAAGEGEGQFGGFRAEDFRRDAAFADRFGAQCRIPLAQGVGGAGQVRFQQHAGVHAQHGAGVGAAVFECSN
ncbi:MAG: hypothetical protein HPY85_16375 [Anaerolineae bacterium]|nr:hypothetical protein [Anaerolineae bacterium]